MNCNANISGSSHCGNPPGRKTRRLTSAIGLSLVGVLTLGLLHTAHAEVHELDEFRYRRLMDHAEAAGYELSVERQIENASGYGLTETALERSGANLDLDMNEDQYLIEPLDSM